MVPKLCFSFAGCDLLNYYRKTPATNEVNLLKNMFDKSRFTGCCRLSNVTRISTIIGLKTIGFVCHRCFLSSKPQFELIRLFCNWWSSEKVLKGPARSRHTREVLRVVYSTRY